MGRTSGSRRTRDNRCTFPPRALTGIWEWPEGGASTGWLILVRPVIGRGSSEVVQIGIIGTPEGIALVRKWLCALIERIPVEDSDQLHTSPWPGFQAVFGVSLIIEPLVTIPIAASDISNAISKTNRVDAIRSTVKLFEEAILEHFRTDERRPDIWLVIVPEKVHRYGRPEVSGPRDATRSALMSERTAAGFLRGGSLFPDMTEEAQTYLFARNFHHQLKAQLLHREAVNNTRSVARNGSLRESYAVRPRAGQNRMEFFDHALFQRGEAAAVAACRCASWRVLCRAGLQTRPFASL